MTSPQPKKSIPYIIILTLVVGVLIYLINREDIPPAPKAVEVFDDVGFQAVNDLNSRIRSLQKTAPANVRKRLLYVLNREEGTTKLISERSGIIDGLKKSGEEFKMELYLHLISPSQFELLLCQLLREIEVEVMSLFLEACRKAESPALAELLQEKTNRIANEGASLTGNPSGLKKLIDYGFTSSYRKLHSERSIKQRVTGIENHALTQSFVGGFAPKLDQIVRKRLEHFVVESKEADFTHMSDRLPEEKLIGEAFGHIHFANAMLKVKNEFSQSAFDFVSTNLTQEKLESYFKGLVGIVDSGRSKIQKDKFRQNLFNKEVFSDLELRKSLNHSLERSMQIIEETCNDYVYDADSLNSLEVKAESKFDTSGVTAAEASTALHSFEIIDQLALIGDFLVTAAGIAGANAPNTAGISLIPAAVAAIGAAVIETTRFSVEFFKVGPQRYKEMQRLKENSCENCVIRSSEGILKVIREKLQLELTPVYP